MQATPPHLLFMYLIHMQWLDDLHMVGTRDHVFSEGGGGGAAAASSRRKEAGVSADAAARQALFTRAVRELSPTEQLWLVRIILHDLRIGIKHEKVRNAHFLSHHLSPFKAPPWPACRSSRGTTPAHWPDSQRPWICGQCE
jgi:hypothetical protein